MRPAPGAADEGSPSSRCRRFRVVVVGGAILLALCVSSPLHDPLNNPNEGVRVFATRAIVEHGTTAIDDVVRDWGYIDDKAARGGRLYSSKAPLVTLLAAVGYAAVHPFTGDLERPALTRLCRVTGSLLPTLAVLAVAWWALRRKLDDPFLADVAIVGLCTGTGLLAALHVFSGHAFVAAVAAAVTAIGLLDERPSRLRLILVGALLSLAACAEYPAALLAPLAFLTTARHRRPLWALSVVVVAGVVAAIPTMIVHTVSFGSPLATGYAFLENPQYRPLVQGTFFGVGAPDPRVLVAVSLSPSVGLFFFAPLCVIGAVALFRLPRRDAVVIAVVALSFFSFIAGFRGWRGGWSVGPRYLSELWGVLIVAGAIALDGVRPAIVRPVACVLVAVGVVHSGIAGALFPHLPDNLANPVGELVIPLVVRGLAPDSLPLLLGLSPPVAVLLIVGAVLSPIVVVSVTWRAPLALLAVVVIVPAVVLVDLALPGTDPAVRGREVRRLLDNWRPEAGVPYLRDGADDPRVLFAIDRGRAARLDDAACAFGPPRPQRPDVGLAARVLRPLAAQGALVGLVVVDDALADGIAPVGGPALIVSFSDVDRLLRRGLPCRGDVVVVRRATARPPRVIAALPVLRSEPLSEGFILEHRRR